MEVHESAFLTLCAANARTFRPGSVVAEYARMRREPDGREAAAFREKTGRLEPCFRDEASLGVLAAALGRDGYGGLLRALREEDHHMLAGGLMHEGVHAGLGDAPGRPRPVRVRGGRASRPMGRDALVHGRDRPSTVFRPGGSARTSPRAGSGRAALLARLEPLRRKGTLGRAADRDVYETLAAGLGAEIARWTAADEGAVAVGPARRRAAQGT
ncbi:MAG: hypothetical protein MZU79_04670 [Anaerotruncus sp.]|nr:hypothetical protein [Anaerotruncus sp.]